MRAVLLFVVAALAVPAAALASKPPHPNTPAKPTVAYVLRGTLTAYTAANGSTNGSVTILVKSAHSGANHVAAALRGQSVSLTLTSSTKVTLHGTWANTDTGVVKFRGQKGLTTVLSSTVATQVIDQTQHTS